MANLHDDFDKEQDLSASFDGEQDLHSSFDKEDDMHLDADKELEKNDSLWSAIVGGAKDTYKETAKSLQESDSSAGHILGKVMQAPMNLANLPAFIKQQAPKEWEKIKDNPAGAAKAAALAPAVSQTLNAAVEKGIAKLDPTLSSDEYQALYGDRSLTDLAKANRAEQEKAMGEFPLTSMASKLATTTALAAPAIAVAPAVAAVIAPTLAYGGIGAIESAEKKYEETGDIKKALTQGGEDLATQGILDVATLGAGKLLKKGVQSLKPAALESAAARQTLKSIGASEDEIARLKNPELVSQELANQGAVGPLTSKKASNTLIKESLSKEGGKLETLVDDISNEVNKAPEAVIADSLDASIQKADKDILDPLRKLGRNDLDPVVFDVKNRLQQIKNLGRSNYEAGSNPTFKQLHEFKQNLGNEIKWNRKTDSTHQQALEQLYHTLDEELDSVSNLTSKGDAYRAQNDKLSRLFTAKSMSDPKESSNLATALMGALKKHPYSSLGLGGVALAKGATMVGLPAGASIAAVGIPAVAVAKYGRQAVAAGLRGAAKVSEKATDVLTRVAASNPELLGKFAAPISQAVKRGPQAISATNFMLSQQYPEYRELMEKLQNQEDPKK